MFLTHERARRTCKLHTGGKAWNEIWTQNSEVEVLITRSPSCPQYDSFEFILAFCFVFFTCCSCCCGSCINMHLKRSRLWFILSRRRFSTWDFISWKAFFKKIIKTSQLFYIHTKLNSFPTTRKYCIVKKKKSPFTFLSRFGSSASCMSFMIRSFSNCGLSLVFRSSEEKDAKTTGCRFYIRPLRLSPSHFPSNSQSRGKSTWVSCRLRLEFFDCILYYNNWATVNYLTIECNKSA